MKILKSKQFEGAYIIKDLPCETEHSKTIYKDNTRHMFLKDAVESDGKMKIPYVFYSRNYRKWYEDVAYLQKSDFDMVMSKIK